MKVTSPFTNKDDVTKKLFKVIQAYFLASNCFFTPFSRLSKKLKKSFS